MNEAKLVLFPNSLEYRFCNPGWRQARTPYPVEQLIAQASEIDAVRCQRLVFSGGSPLEHPKFVELVKVCRELGLKHFALETDARPLARPGVVESLERLGFEQLILIVGGIRERTHNAVTQETGTFKVTLEGLRRALHGNIRTYLIAPVLKSTLEDLDPLLDWAIEMGGEKLTGFLLSLPEIDHVPEESRHELLPYSTQAQVAARLFRKCQGNNVEYGFSTKRGITPCATTRADGQEGILEHFSTVFHDRFNYFQHSHDEKLTRVSACEQCSLTNSCNGVEETYVKHFGTEEFVPVPLDVSMNWKLRRINRLEQFDYHNISPFKNDSPVNPRGLIRINGHCNMSCSFCFVDRTAPDFASDGLQEEILQMAKGGTRHLVLSGGEPTLHKQLPELIRFARSLNAFDVIEMQSNGVKCAEMEYTRELIEAGLNKVTVSLHSVDPEKSDMITRLPNAFPKTVQAMHNFRELGVLTQIAHVITKANYQELPDTVRFLRKEFPADKGHLSICFAIAQGISDLVFHWVIPTFSEIKPYFSNALDYCLETGIGFGGMIGQGGYPPCMLDGDLRYYEAVLDKVFKSADYGDQFHKLDKCKECSFDAYCLGPRKSYVEHYGSDEIKPFKADLPPPRARVPGMPDSDPAMLDVFSAEGAQDMIVRGAPTSAPNSPSIAGRSATASGGLRILK